MKKEHIYVIQDGDGLYKIGMSGDPKTRLTSLRWELQKDLKLLWAWRCRNSRRHEKRLHHCFREARVYGEWFRLSENDLLTLHFYFDPALNDKVRGMLETDHPVLKEMFTKVEDDGYIYFPCVFSPKQSLPA